MEDETLGFFKKTSSSHARLNVPALVQVAALAIIMIRGLDVLMIFNTLGVRGIGEFIHRSVQTWSLTLVFLSSLVLVFIEIWCAFSLVKGRRWSALAVSVDTNHSRKLLVGGFAGVWLSGAVQHSR